MQWCLQGSAQEVYEQTFRRRPCVSVLEKGMGRRKKGYVGLCVPNFAKCLVRLVYFQLMPQQPGQVAIAI